MELEALVGGAVNSTRDCGKSARYTPNAQNNAYFDSARPVNDERNGPGCDVLPADFRYDDTAKSVTGSILKVS